MIVKAEKLAQGGRAVGHLEDGRVVFIDGLFPNEEAEISIVEDKSSYCNAKVLSIITRSPERRESTCPKSSECGGCPWIELDYQAQLEAKTQIVKELFSDFPDIRFEEPVTGPEFGYRSRARFQYRIENGKAKLGFCAENSNKNIAIETCPVADRKLNDLIQNPPRLNAWELKNSELSCITTDDGVLYDDKAGWITINGKRLPVSNRVFFQSNLILLPQMIDYVVSLTEGPNVMDLYSGVGTFSAYLEDRFDVTAVEINKYCLSMAKSHLKHTQFFTSPVEKWNPKTRKVDTVIVDPPRVGLDRKVPDMIASWNPKRIVYVSCYAPTMHRDIQRLAQLGYKPQSLKLFDFYPQTPHVETCVLLSNETCKPKEMASIKVDMDGLNFKQEKQKEVKKTTYDDIKDYVLKKYGYKITSIYIAQVKGKLGIKERKNYNIGEGKGIVPHCPPEKEEAIKDALRHFCVI